MRVIKRYNQNRRDLDIDIKCEGCGFERTYRGAYDDRNFWDNVVPSFKCDNCKKSSIDLKSKLENIPTKYSEGMQL